MSAGQMSRSSKRDLDESTQSAGRGSGTGVYTTDFPDSTRDTALLSPPDLALKPLFSFDPEVSSEFPDWSEREFLKPTLHVKGTSSGSAGKEDLYERIEARLRGYRNEGEKNSRNGMQQGKNGFGHPSENPFSSEKPFSKEAAGTEGLTKRSTSSAFNF